ncbi:hypothetical protein CSKR_113530 [Clonorchis sinensis]|uniref:Uncharacterized protein n=2 Tax=Clonorchis sinensis TaxID=79923 RepID=A0A8T1MA51_CLOSI|nr:hypothetical protein CSKR_113530 [Clonorchis sinensis]GAA31114.1 hypothetical protein CLF_111935 [Clonorchis sinensis]
MSGDQLFKNYVSKIFDAWTVARLCREQCPAGRLTDQKLDSLIECMPDIVRRVKDECLLEELIEDYFDDELNTICEDESIQQVAKLLFHGMSLLKANNLTELQRKLESLPTGCDMSKCQQQVVCQASESEEEQSESSYASLEEEDVEME